MQPGRGDIPPPARTEGVVIKTLADEVLVYDLERHRAHALNGAAAAVWRQCDGRQTREEIRRAAAQAGQPLGADGVDYALAELDRAHLLDEPEAGAGQALRPTRRQLLRRMGVAAAVSLPLVTSIAAPTPAAAQSCLPLGATCTSVSQCCDTCIPDEPITCVGICFCNT